jgi:hypothetical protein
MLGERFEKVERWAYSLAQAKLLEAMSHELKHGIARGALFVAWGDCFEIEMSRPPRQTSRAAMTSRRRRAAGLSGYPCADVLGTDVYGKAFLARPTWPEEED